MSALQTSDHSAPSATSKQPLDTDDKSPVNSALIIFLQGLTSLGDGTSLKWVMNHVEFRPTFRELIVYVKWYRKGIKGEVAVD